MVLIGTLNPLSQIQKLFLLFIKMHFHEGQH